MSKRVARLRVANSRAQVPIGSVGKGPARDERQIQVVVILKTSGMTGGRSVLAQKHAGAKKPLWQQAPISRKQLKEELSPDEAHIEQVKSFAEDHGLTVVDISRSQRDMTLEGPVSAMNAAFGVELHDFEHETGNFHAHLDDIHLPESLHDVIEGVIGLDHSPLIDPMADPGGVDGPVFNVLELARHYNYPETTGRGQRIAILNFGKCGFHESDICEYFDKILGIGTPSINVVPIDRCSNEPMDYGFLKETITRLNNGDFDFDPKDPDVIWATATMEATMDIQIAGGIASDAEIDVYFAPMSVPGFYSAITAALDLRGKGNGKPTAISISWGGSESRWGDKIDLLEKVMAPAELLHVPICCASGDMGSLNAKPVERSMDARVNYPASSRHALACGGTSFLQQDQISEMVETTWKSGEGLGTRSTGGGVSGCIELPDYQSSAAVPSHATLSGAAWRRDGFPEDFHGRGVPDVAAFADRGYRVYVGGQEFINGGTSAATPMWAGLIARLSEALGKPIGCLNQLLYEAESRPFVTPVTTGDNRIGDTDAAYFEARDGWNGCCGLGVPDGVELSKYLEQAYAEQA